jgi:hypothetical protein
MHHKMTLVCLICSYRVHKSSGSLIKLGLNPGQILNLAQHTADVLDALYHGFLVVLIAQVRSDRDSCAEARCDGHATT